MKMNVSIKSYSQPIVNHKEILRYSQGSANAKLNDRLDQLLKECLSQISYKVAYCRLPIRIKNDCLDLCFCTTQSKDLAKNLKGCKEIILFAATIGLPFDRILAKHCRLAPLDGLLMQSIGTERIEALANAFEEDMKSLLLQEDLYTTPRFSSGYGDLSLSIQSDIFRFLDCPKNLGMSLSDQLLMTPSKSITAIIGIKEKK